MKKHYQIRNKYMDEETIIAPASEKATLTTDTTSENPEAAPAEVAAE